MAVVVLLPVGAIALAGHYNKLGFVVAALPGHRVDLPRDDAEPQAVVVAYLTALDAHDRRTAIELNPRAEVWIGAVRSISDIRIVRADMESGMESGEGGNGPRAVVVAEFTIRTFNAEEFFWADGRHSWAYYLRRKTGGGPWRIVDEGLG